MDSKWLTALSALFVLTACGGGSSSSSVQAPVQGLGMIPITEATAQETAATVVKSVDGAFDAGESALDFGGVVGARIEGDTTGAVRTALSMVDRVRESAVSATWNTAVGAVIEEARDCSGGGMVTMSIDTGSLSEEQFTTALQEGTIPSGTSFRIAFEQCIEPDEGTLDGVVTMVIQELSVNGELGVDSFTMAFDVAFDDFTSSEGRIDGDISLRVVSSAGQTDSSIGGSSLQVSVSGEVLALLDYDVTAIEDTSALVQTFDFTLSVSSLGGRLTVETLESMRTLAFAENPISGVLRIVGRDNGSITVTALDEVSVELRVDADGDGEVDATIITTWDELEA